MRRDSSQTHALGCFALRQQEACWAPQASTKWPRQWELSIRVEGVGGFGND